MKFFRGLTNIQMGRLLSNNASSFFASLSLTHPKAQKKLLRNFSSSITNSTQLPHAQTSSSSASERPIDGQPVPNLSATLLNFLAFNHAFSKKRHRTTDEIARITEAYKVCREMANDEKVLYLQNKLRERAKAKINWLSEWWQDVAYLKTRTPLPIITSPGVMLPDLKGYPNNRDGQIEFAINLIYANIQFFHELISEKLKPDRTSNGDLLDMSQYNFLFGTTRIPRKNSDVIVTGCSREHWFPHIVVVHNGHTFRFPIMTESLDTLPRAQLRQQFAEVFAQSETENIDAVNICSTEERNTWAAIYDRLKERNSSEVETVETALFVLALDRTVNTNDSSHSRETEKLRQSLHGGGSSQNTKNRWFDKTLQYAINDCCEGVMTYEHTPSEGPPLARLLDFVVDYLVKNTPADLNSINDDDKNSTNIKQKVEKLEFFTDSTIKEAIRNAEQNIDTTINNLEVLYYKFQNFGKNVLKRAKISPDSFIQIAMQLAFHRMHHCHPTTYETATLRKFPQGRTETLRLPNDESVAFVEAVNNMANVADGVDTKALLLDAIRAHKNYSIIAMNGHGMDRHLLGLRLMAEECGISTPSLYSSHAYEHLMHFRLSTSQVPFKNQMAMCFGPSASDCYGICYNPQEASIGFTISAYRNHLGINVQVFSKMLERALCDLQEILDDNMVKNLRSKI